MDVDKRFETKDIIFELKNEILFVTYKKGAVITYEKAIKIVDDRLSFLNGKQVPGIGLDLGIMGVDKKAREYFSSDKGIEGLNAFAFVSSSVFNRYLANFFITIEVVKPKIPTRIFNDKNKALLWLEQFKNQ